MRMVPSAAPRAHAEAPGALLPPATNLLNMQTGINMEGVPGGELLE
jgi:hypothetical protein